MLTRKAVLHNATPDPNEVLVVFEDENGVTKNVLLRDAATLRAELTAEREPAALVKSGTAVSAVGENPSVLDEAPARVFSEHESAAFAAAEANA